MKGEVENEGLTNFGWIYKKAEELMLAGMNVKTVRKYLVNLIEKGYLLRRKNPNLEYDKTYQYRINLKRVIVDLNKAGYELEGFEDYFTRLALAKGQIGSSKVQNDSFEHDNNVVIPRDLIWLLLIVTTSGY